LRPSKRQSSRVPILGTQTLMPLLQVGLRSERQVGEQETSARTCRDCLAGSLTIIQDHQREDAARRNSRLIQRAVARERTGATMRGRLRRSELAREGSPAGLES